MTTDAERYGPGRTVQPVHRVPVDQSGSDPAHINLVFRDGSTKTVKKGEKGWSYQNRKAKKKK